MKKQFLAWGIGSANDVIRCGTHDTVEQAENAVAERGLKLAEIETVYRAESREDAIMSAVKAGIAAANALTIGQETAGPTRAGLNAGFDLSSDLMSAFIVGFKLTTDSKEWQATRRLSFETVRTLTGHGYVTIVRESYDSIKVGLGRYVTNK